MINTLDYRTDDPSQWGAGTGADLDAVNVDNNFWKLYSAIQGLEASQRNGAGIDFINMVGGNQLYVHLTDHRILGPFTVPATVWNPRGAWRPFTNYFPLDVVSVNGALYIVNVSNTSAATFSPNATDGLSHDLYTLLLTQPQDMLPAGGSQGMRLAKATASPYATQWEYDRIRLALFIVGRPDNSELLLQYGVTDHMTIPSGLAGSVAYASVAAAATSVFTIEHNSAVVGEITFNPSPSAPSVSFAADVVCVPGDVISIVAPPHADTHLANISFTIVANLTE